MQRMGIITMWRKRLHRCDYRDFPPTVPSVPAPKIVSRAVGMVSLSGWPPSGTVPVWGEPPSCQLQRSGLFLSAHYYCNITCVLYTDLISLTNYTTCAQYVHSFTQLVKLVVSQVVLVQLTTAQLRIVYQLVQLGPETLSLTIIQSRKTRVQFTSKILSPADDKQWEYLSRCKVINKRKVITKMQNSR